MDIDFETLLSLAPNPYIVVDRDLRIVWMNEAYLETTMRQRDHLAGRGLFDAFPSEPGSESHDLLSSSLRRVLESRQRDEIALIRYDIEKPDGTMEQRFWSATHTPLLDASGEVSHILQHTVDVTELHRLRELRREADLIKRAGAVQARNLDLETEQARLRALFSQAPGFMAIVVGRDHRFQMANASFNSVVGREQLEGRTVAEAMPEVVEQGFVKLLDRVLDTGEPYIGKGQEVVFRTGPDQHDERRFLDFIYQPILHHEETVGVFVVGHDVTEGREALEHRDRLIDEINHRVKNTLAIVQSLARQSFKGIDGAQPSRRAFEERLRALAGTHDLLSESNWRPVSLAALIGTATGAVANADQDRIEQRNCAIELSPRLAISLATVVHELTSNAVLYGALSEQSGRVTVTCDKDSSGRLVMDWSESGGPPLAAPRHRGFGTRLIESGMASETGERARLEFNADGLRCRIVLPDEGTSPGNDARNNEAGLRCQETPQ